MNNLPELGSVWQTREDSRYARGGIVVGILEEPSVTVRHADGTQTKYAASVVRRDLEPAADLSDVPDEVLEVVLARRRQERGDV